MYMSTIKHSFLSAVMGFLAGGVAAALFVVAGLMLLSSQPGLIQHWLQTEAVSEPGGSLTDTVLPVADQENQIVTVVEKVNPAVVSIVATQDVPVYEQYYDQGNPFGFSFPQYRQNGTEEQEVSSGSGFFVSADGLVVTNKHVVSEAEADYTIFTSTGAKYDASVIALDPSNDVAVIKVEGTDFPYLEFGDSKALKIGQTTLAIGNALGEFSNSVSVGIVSGLGRSIEAGDGLGSSEQLQDIIQTDAAINPGNSGGPLLNLNGEVIGVNVAMANAENIGFALPANLIKSVVDSVKTTGKISRPQLGVRYVMVTDELKAANELPVNYGALLIRGETPTDLAVIPGSAADKAGLEENDIILEVNGQTVDADHVLATLLNQYQVGDEVTLKILHDGTEQMVSVLLAER